LIAICIEGVVVAAGILQDGYVVRTDITEGDAPGTYLWLGHESRDELRLQPDGSFSRTAVYRGVAQHQSGRWHFDSFPSQVATSSAITFENASPRCLRSTAPPDTTPGYSEPNEYLCLPADGIEGAVWCRVRGRGLALCLGNRIEFLKQ
jgi:hypothetical protein